MKQILIFKEEIRAHGQEYQAKFYEDYKLIKDVVIFKSDIRHVGNMIKGWEDVSVIRTWRRKDAKKKLNARHVFITLPGKKTGEGILVIDIGKDTVTKCNDCNTTLSLRYVKAKGLRCPKCKKIFDEIQQGMTEHFKQKGEKKARAILKVMETVNVKE